MTHFLDTFKLMLSTQAIVALNFLILLCYSLIAPIALAEEPKRFTKHIRTIVIDPGHGGDNTGAMSIQGVWEKYITLQVAQRLRNALEAVEGLEVHLTREDDTALELRERAQLASGWSADIFVSIHANAALHDRAHGVETYFLSADAALDERGQAAASSNESATPPWSTLPDELLRRRAMLLDSMQRDASHQLSEQLATLVHHAIVSRTGAFDRGVKQADFTVLREADFPAIVVEMGFLTHPLEGERLLLSDYQERVAQALADAFLAYDAALPARPSASSGDPPESASAAE